MLTLTNAPNAEELRASSKHFAFEEGKLYDYNSSAIRNAARIFYEEERHLIPKFHTTYQPNPFIWQYDLEIFIFLNYEDLQEKELQIARSRGDNERVRFVERHGFSGLERHEHLFNAAAIRWPNYEQPDGSLQGEFIRHPWVEDDWRCATQSKFVLTFGGGGQGKTHGWLAFMCLIWDHFIYTNRGAKCIFSTVSETKLKGAAWPYLQRIYVIDETLPKFSQYAGRGKIVADYTIKRAEPEKIRDTAGVIQGILVGKHLDDQAVVDKFTGTHGHPAFIALIDEMQSTPEAPVKASQNYLRTPTWGWLFSAANYGTDTDTNGKNVKPKAGWDSVNEETHIWEGETQNGRPCIVIHKNNNLSPGMLSEYWRRRCPFLPNPGHLAEDFPTEFARQSEGYRRFWLGWRDTDNVFGYVIMETQVVKGNADQDFVPEGYEDLKNHFSLDSAPANQDRNMLLHFSDGVSRDDRVWRWGCREFMGLQKVLTGDHYYRQSCDEITDLAHDRRVLSGQMICDHSNMGGHPEMLAERCNFITHTLMYQERPPDGKYRSNRNNQVEPPVIAVTRADGQIVTFAHQVCANRITMGAFALRAYIRLGVVRGFNRKSVSTLMDQGYFNAWEQEFFRREIATVVSATHGERECLKKKEDFKDEYGFSPDALDTLFQAAYYMWVVRGMPIDRVIKKRRGEQTIDPQEDLTKQVDETQDQWGDSNLFDEIDADPLGETHGININSDDTVDPFAEAVDFDDEFAELDC